MLMRMGFNPNQVDLFLQEHNDKYSPLIDFLFKRLINENPFGGIPVTDVRNPTLGRGSVQGLIITEIKTDPRDQTTGHPILNVSLYNAT